MLLETERLIIRDLESEDEIPFIEMAQDGSLTEDIGFDKECSEWMAGWILEAKELAEEDNPNKGYIAYTVVLKDNNAVIGSVGCSYYEDLKKTGITYFIGTEYRNNGYAAEAVRAYSRYFLKHYSLEQLIATIWEENVPSCRVIEKAGFELIEKKLYKDINDEHEKIYNFYELKKNISL